MKRTRHASVTRKKRTAANFSSEIYKAPKIQKLDVQGRKVDSNCWLCHQFVDIIVACRTCPRVFHMKCLSKIQTFKNTGKCEECLGLSLDGCKGSNSLGKLRLKDLLLYAFQESLYDSSKKHSSLLDSKYCTYFQTWPEVLSTELCYIIDLTILIDKINDDMSPYKSAAEFFSDVKWIYHNSFVLYGPHANITVKAQQLEKNFRNQLMDLEACAECFYLKHRKCYDNPFVFICRKPHDIVWAKIRGCPYWPAKCLYIKNGRADVRFFGTHEKSIIPISQCYRISLESPNSSEIKTKKFLTAMAEFQEYVKNFENQYLQKFPFYEKNCHVVEQEPEQDVDKDAQKKTNNSVFPTVVCTRLPSLLPSSSVSTDTSSVPSCSVSTDTSSDWDGLISDVSSEPCTESDSSTMSMTSESSSNQKLNTDQSDEDTNDDSVTVIKEVLVPDKGVQRILNSSALTAALAERISSKYPKNIEQFVKSVSDFASRSLGMLWLNTNMNCQKESDVAVFIELYEKLSQMYHKLNQDKVRLEEVNRQLKSKLRQSQENEERATIKQTNTERIMSILFSKIIPSNENMQELDKNPADMRNLARRFELHARQVEQKNSLIKELKNDITAKAALIKEQNAVLEEKNKQMTEQDTLLEKINKEIKEQLNLLEEKNKEIKEQGNLLVERNKEIEELTNLLEEKNKKVKEQGILLEGRNKQIKEQEELTDMRNGVIKEVCEENNKLSELLKSANSKIADLEKILVEIKKGKKLPAKYNRGVMAVPVLKSAGCQTVLSDSPRKQMFREGDVYATVARELANLDEEDDDTDGTEELGSVVVPIILTTTETKEEHCRIVTRNGVPHTEVQETTTNTVTVDHPPLDMLPPGFLSTAMASIASLPPFSSIPNNTRAQQSRRRGGQQSNLTTRAASSTSSSCSNFVGLPNAYNPMLPSPTTKTPSRKKKK